jgi:transposase
MSRRKYEPEVYLRAKLDLGLSNREIARHFGVHESTVRRGLGTRDDNAALLTEQGRARKRRFRLRETLSRMTTRLKEKP